MSVPRSQNPPEPSAIPFRPWAHWMALGAAFFTLPLLYVGGSVTTYRVGLAVPDWPTTFGINMFLFDMWNQPFGVRVEHSHRLYGAAVGLFTLILSSWLLFFEPRKWLKWLGVLAVVTVIIQGVLGGMRVTQISTVLAAVHACVAQAFFALLVALCVFTGRSWQRPVEARSGGRGVKLLGFALLLLVPAQIVLGSWLRHFATWPALAGHAFLGAAVWGSCLFLAFVVERQKKNWPSLVPAARALGVVATLQIVLGLGAFSTLLPFDGTPRFVSFYQAVTRTVHQTGGAVLLAAAVVFNLRSHRQLAGTMLLASLADHARSFRGAARAALKREAVA